MRTYVRFVLPSITLLFGIAVLPSQPIYGYIDPNSGSLALQTVMAGIFGAVFAVKTWGRKILPFLKKSSASKGDGQHED